MKAPTVSVIVPTFNRAHYIAQALDSLLAQTVAAHQVVVVDDGSSDDTAAVVRRYGQRVQYVHQANAGKSSAVNLGLTLCEGDLIWLFDDDDVALADAIETRLAALATQPQADFVYSSHYLGSEDNQGRIVRGALYVPQPPPAPAFFLEIMRSCFFHLNSALVPRRFYQRLQGLDASLLRSQDYDFQIRLARVAQPTFSKAPSFVFREHAGVRGAEQLRHAVDDRAAMLKRFSTQVGAKLRAALSLGEYLTPPQASEPTLEQRQLALLNRLSVMANHGCVRAYLDDLAALTELAGEMPLTAATAKAIARSYQMGWMHDATEQDWEVFIVSLKRLSTRPAGRAAVRAVSRGLMRLATGFPGHPAVRARRAKQAVQIALASLA